MKKALSKMALAKEAEFWKSMHACYRLAAYSISHLQK
jgi:hypothetical protein